MRYDVPLIDHAMNDYFRDIQDHVIRVVEGIDNLRDLLTAALEANLLLVSLAQNDVTKKLTGWAAILSIPLAIASIYGMNFKWMPELEAPYGYPAVMTLILGLCGLLVLPIQARGLDLSHCVVRQPTRPRARMNCGTRVRTPRRPSDCAHDVR